MSDELFSVKMKELRESTGHRNAPPYVLRLLSYYVEMQRQLNENGINEK